ncbi:EXS family-domain-containing protein [Neocallimastix lanati (nom. inval.)]|nr:EXS family-domain-containing protein [Neocallimastix sp. JGI-2020a]
MKYGQTLLHQSVPEWKKKYINYKALKKAIKRINSSKQNMLSEIENTIKKSKSGSRLFNESSIDSNVITELPEETEFRKLLDIELDKINNFYAEREIEIVNKLILIVQQIEIFSNTETKKVSVKPVGAFKGAFSHKRKESFSKDLESSDPSVYNDVKFKNKKAKSKLKNALLELYREMFLLKNYKIMKRNFSTIYINKVENSHFHTSKVLEKVIKQSEKEHHSIIWRSGFCLGLGLPIIYSIISKFVNEDLSKKIDNLEIILQIFGGLSLPIIFLLLFGVNLIVWKKYKINYVFIFEFDSRKHLTPWEFIEVKYKCNSSTSWFISIVTVVPGWIRFLQCLRRYYNTHRFNPHLLNAGKYMVGIISILLGHLYLRVIWIISLVATSSYSYTWDVLMDWGFFQKNSKNKFLRDDLIFPTWSYYYVMISNLFLRTIWLFTVSPNYWGVIKNGNIVAYVTALVEVFRRFQWNFFRMENEHTNNCGDFRAVKEMPLPYNIENNSEDDDDNSYSHYDTVNDSSSLRSFLCKSQQLIHSNRNSKASIESDSFNISNVKFWNIKPCDYIKSYNNSYSFTTSNSSMISNFDFQDPSYSNQTIHSYNEDSDFNQFLSKMKENLSSLDTIIKRYDNKQESNQLSIQIEKFVDKHQTFNIFDFDDSNVNTYSKPFLKVKSKSLSRNSEIIQVEMEEDKFLSDPKAEKNKLYYRNSETIRIDTEMDKVFYDQKPLSNLFNEPKPKIRNIDDVSSACLSRSESITLYSIKQQ